MTKRRPEPKGKNTEAFELLEQMRQMAVDIEVQRARRHALEESVARARSIALRDPEMNVQHSRDVRDTMGETVATITDMDADLRRMEKILEADRQRARRIAKRMDRDCRQIVQLYYIDPIVGEWGQARSWRQIEELLHMSHATAMRRRRQVFATANELIRHGM